MAGAATRIIFIADVLRAMAFINSRSSTKSAMNACRVGMMKDEMTPERKDAASRCQNSINPVWIRMATTMVIAATPDCVTINRLRLSMRSATTPPKGEKIRTEKPHIDQTRPRRKVESVNSTTSHPRATISIMMAPKENRYPIHNHRYSRFFRAANVFRPWPFPASLADPDGSPEGWVLAFFSWVFKPVGSPLGDL